MLAGAKTAPCTPRCRTPEGEQDTSLALAQGRSRSARSARSASAPCRIDSGGGRPQPSEGEGAEVPGPELGDARAKGGTGSQPTPPPMQPSNLESNATSSASPAASPAQGNSVEAPLGAVPAVPAVQVCVRMRPLLAWERAEGYKESAMEVRESPSGGMGICMQTEGRRNRHFQFNSVIGPERSQQEAWEMSKIDSVISKVCKGFNATVFAYGQTGTGKTFTMEGFDYDTSQAAPSLTATSSARPRVKARSTPSEQLGMVPRAVRALFEKLPRRSEPPDGMNGANGANGADSCGDETRGVSGVVVRVSFLQIYKEKIFDLLNPISSVSQREAARAGEDLGGLRMRWDAMKRHFFVENLFQYECGSADEALQHYQDGIANKQVASTTMNVASSRSHTLLVFTVLRREGLESGQGREVVSQLSLVDLAGSERTLASTDTTQSGARFVEAVNVNQSLFVLRRVITALSKRDSQNATDHTHVPYRESKLTSLLQNSLGGNSYLIMFACLAASERHDDENLSTLQYASQAACIRNEPQVNIDPKDRKIQELEAKLSIAHGYLLQALSLTELPSDLLEKERAAAVSASGATGKFRPSRKDRQVPQPPQPPREKMEKTAPQPPRSRFSSKEKVASPTTSTATSWSKSEEGERGEGTAAATAATLAREGLLGSQRLEPRKHPKAPKPPRNGPGSLGDRLGLSARNPRSSTFSRLLQGEKSPRSSDWPFFARKPRTEGSELFAAVEDVLRSYDGASDAEPRNPWAAPLPPMASRRKESAANSARRPSSLPPVVPELENEIGGDSAPLPPLPCKLWPRKPEVISDASASAQGQPEFLEPEATGKQRDDGGFDLPAPPEEADSAANDEELSTCRRDLAAAQQRLQELELEAKQMPGELTKLRAENTQLMSELQVFYKAMESKEPQDATKQRLEKFHSQLVLEAASLRNEVAGLKRKRWVIQAVLANGGDSEDRVIKEELQKLRQKKSEEQPEQPEHPVPSLKG